jgi:hypothetical protein
LITGDIATTASEDDLQAAKDLLSGEIGFDAIENIPIDPFLEKNKYPLSYYESAQLLPGNHDRFQIHGDTNFKDQGLETFSEVFHEKWEKNTRINFTYDDHFITVFVDFSLPADFNSGMYFDHDNGNEKINKRDKYMSFLGRGIYTKKLRKELEDLLDKIKESPLKDKKILFFSHFSLTSSYDSLRLINAKMLIATLQKYNITVYFCGHTHEIDFMQIEDNIQHICCGSTTGCDMNDKYSFLVHTISLDTENIYTLESDSYIYSTEDRYFKKDNSRKCII